MIEMEKTMRDGHKDQYLAFQSSTCLFVQNRCDVCIIRIENGQ